MGRFWVNSNGFIQNDSEWSKIQSEFEPAVSKIKERISSIPTRSLHSAYLTGSVSRGTAIRNESDLDVICIAKARIADLDFDPLVIAGEIKAECSFLSDVQIECWPWDYVFPKDEKFSIGAFVIKTHSICLVGDDLSEKIPFFSMSPETMGDDVLQIESDIQEALRNIENGSIQTIEYWCKRICKNIIRAAYGLICLQVGKPTRDLDLCVSEFVKRFPEKRYELEHAYNLVKQPIPAREPLVKYLESFGFWLITQAREWKTKYKII